MPLVTRSQYACSAGKGQLGMIADEQRAIGIHSGGKLSCNDRACPGFQRPREMFLIIDEDQMIPRRRFEARHAGDFNLAVANQARLQRLRDLTNRALHSSHCIAEMQDEERVGYSGFLIAAAAAVGVQVAVPWHMMKFPLPALQWVALLPGVRDH